MLRNPNSIPNTDTVITDPVMEPFFITKSQSGGYTVYQRVIKGDNDTQYIKTIGYPSTFGTALKSVAKEILNEGGKTYDLKSYVKRWESVKDSLTSILE